VRYAEEVKRMVVTPIFNYPPLNGKALLAELARQFEAEWFSKGMMVIIILLASGKTYLGARQRSVP
jgi:hypothetical protein